MRRDSLQEGHFILKHSDLGQQIVLLESAVQRLRSFMNDIEFG